MKTAPAIITEHTKKIYYVVDMYIYTQVHILYNYAARTHCMRGRMPFNPFAYSKQSKSSQELSEGEARPRN